LVVRALAGGMGMRPSGATRRVLSLFVRPVAIAYLAVRVRALRDVPTPRDSGHGEVPGRDPLRIAVIGDATAVAYGTVSQQLGVAGHYARLLSRREQRGVEWFTALFPGYTIRTAMTVVSDGASFAGVDRVVVTAGIRDAIGLMPVHTWARLVDEILITLRSSLPGTASITVAEIPPLELYSSIPLRTRRFIAAHARELNRATREVVARHEGVRTIAFGQEHAIDLQDLGDTGASRLYRGWARSLLAAEPTDAA
jgi:hypothetical protein